MFNEPGGMPIAGGMVLAVLLYGATSLFITGPVIGERTIQKMNWNKVCVRHISDKIHLDEVPIRSVPKLGCMQMFGGWFGADGAAYCEMHGDLFENNPINNMIDGIAQSERELQKKRIDRAVKQAGTRCDCAVTTTLEKRRTDFALYAGSLRFVQPRSVSSLQSELKTNLNSSNCASKG
jgi:hypothetical protein